jgi:uncharacterized protein (DUF433 family)
MKTSQSTKNMTREELLQLIDKAADEAELLHNYPGLSGFDLENACRYYDRHHEEIDRIISSHQTDD